MKRFLIIEWLIETIDAYGDIIEVTHADTYAEALKWAEGQEQPTQIGLVRDRGNEVDGLVDRQWAYIEADSGKLPDHFSDSGGCIGPAVPARYHNELNRMEG
jgi:hypothetical protein